MPSQIFQPFNIIQFSDFVSIQNFKTSQDGSVSAICYSKDNRGIVVHIPLQARDSFLVQNPKHSNQFWHQENLHIPRAPVVLCPWDKAAGACS